VSALHTAALCRAFGANQVLKSIDLSVAPFTVHGLVGLNGAGKTTLIRILLGVLRAGGGSVRVLGVDPWEHPPSMYQRMGVVLEHDGFWGTMTFGQNMSVYAAAKGVGKDALGQYLREWWQDCGLVQSTRKARHFSRGQRMQSALCRAFLGWPEVVILDEPTVGLDVEAYDHFGVLVREARRRGSAVLVSSHQLDAIECLCDEVSLLEGGVLSGLTCAGTAEAWFLAARGGSGDAAKDLAAAGAVDVVPEGTGWRFRIAGGRAAVPGLVKALVDRGWGVEEVRPAAGRLRESMRRRSAGGSDA
jgi:ABC-type multidrug transport system ATPase subunit